MEYSFYDFLKLLGSLALFLYGMKIMSEGLQKFAGDRLRSILTAMTTNRVTGVLTGMLITALIQSSSATTVMVCQLRQRRSSDTVPIHRCHYGSEHRYYGDCLDHFRSRI